MARSIKAPAVKRTVTQLEALTKEFEEIQTRIAKERDTLRELVDQMDELLEPVEELNDDITKTIEQLKRSIEAVSGVV